MKNKIKSILDWSVDRHRARGETAAYHMALIRRRFAWASKMYGRNHPITERYHLLMVKRMRQIGYDAPVARLSE